MMLSVIIPAFNEERTLGAVIERVLQVPVADAGFTLEIVVVDDCSRDGTFEVARQYPEVRLIRNSVNQGKGRSVRNGIENCLGDVVLVQDADLEYEPEDYPALLRAWTTLADECGKEKAVVYGSRFLGQLRAKSGILPGKHPRQSIGPWGANLLLSTITFILTGRWFTDLLTAYKLYPGQVIRELPTKTKGFETDHELTMRLHRRGCMFREVPIAYHPRSKAEGKKIKAIDFLHAVRTLVRFRLAD